MVDEKARRDDGLPDIRQLRDEVARYRTASEDALQQLDWCIGYFAGTNKQHIARSLSANRAYIRERLLHRPDESTPTSDDPGEN
jgi:hypothetical protein